MKTILTWLLLSLSLPTFANEISGHHHHGDRHGMHGMVLFGESTYYLSHIPMDRRPHNEQLIMQVSLTTADGTPLTQSFAAEGFSIKPNTALSLDNLIIGQVTEFSGDIHTGNFEHGGPVLAANVKIKIEKVVVARNLDQDPNVGYDSFVLQESATWLINRITDERARQHIQRIELATPPPATNPGVALKVSVQDEAAGTVLFLKKPGTNSGTELPFTSLATTWCLLGPDFFQACP